MVTSFSGPKSKNCVDSPKNERQTPEIVPRYARPVTLTVKRPEMPQIGRLKPIANLKQRLEPPPPEVRLPMKFSSHNDHTKRKAPLHRTTMVGAEQTVTLSLCHSVVILGRGMIRE
jgi:hypothetical protein